MKLTHQLSTTKQGEMLLHYEVYADASYYSGEGHKDDELSIDAHSFCRPIPRYSVPELSIMLPDGVVSAHSNQGWIAMFKKKDEKTTVQISKMGVTQADALAWLLINLLADQHITAEFCNQRLLKA